MSVFWKQTKMETKLFLRYKGTLFWNFVFPLFFMTLFGLIFGRDGGDVRYIDFLLPGMIVMALMTTCIQSTTISVVSDREKGIFRRLALTPLRRSTLIGSLALTRYLIVLMQTVLLILVAMLLFQAHIKGNWFFFWLILTVGMFSLLGIGFLIASFVRTEESALSISMIVFFLLMFLSPCFWSVETLPKFLRPFSRILPATFLGQALREVSIKAKGFSSFGLDLLFLLGWLVACFLISARCFKWE